MTLTSENTVLFCVAFNKHIDTLILQTWKQLPYQTLCQKANQLDSEKCFLK